MMPRLTPLAAALAAVCWLASGPAPALASKMTATAEAVNGTASFQLLNAPDAAAAQQALALIISARDDRPARSVDQPADDPAGLLRVRPGQPEGPAPRRLSPQPGEPHEAWRWAWSSRTAGSPPAAS